MGLLCSVETVVLIGDADGVNVLLATLFGLPVGPSSSHERAKHNFALVLLDCVGSRCL